MSTVPRPARGPRKQQSDPKPSPKSDKENRVLAKTTGKSANLDAFGEELEEKYNIEGCNTADIVYACQENDTANPTMRKMTRSQTRWQGRRQLLAGVQAGAERGDQTLEALQSILRPPSSAGTNFNIQYAMGLGRNTKDRVQYKTIQRNLRDLALKAGINWEIPWADTSAEAKGKLFAAAHTRHPYLEQFHNDWATEEIVKQYMKNKRNNAYRNQWLEVPSKYAYLMANSAKRHPSGFQEGVGLGHQERQEGLQRQVQSNSP
ncbi:hypothetical protein B0H10DRAFT_1954244 [Mycena sp. CBHHK59/15]|nr:hypothetical protein B0H10DRAFT_1954244 [Mycena sp. CBHHK59/15]